jgi:dTDP-glucose 4,6-dehydratase
MLGKPRSLIRYVKDRPGHDRRYAIDCTKIERELGWRPETPFEKGLRDTVAWYREHSDWVAAVRASEYPRCGEGQYPSLAS